MSPFFSIGVTTYNRHALLKECLAAIRSQTFGDFEAIIGNDYTCETISAQSLGIKDDPRLRFLNHPGNLGEVGNCNAMLAASRGRYFAWLADDDIQAPAFLQSVHSALTKEGFPKCVLTSYSQGKAPTAMPAEPQAVFDVMDGRTFLRRYFSGSIRTLGYTGVFSADYLRSIGGLELTGTPQFSPYCDNLMAIKTGLLDKVIYINAPLIFWRVHGECRSATTRDIATYYLAQRDVLTKSVAIFRNAGLRPDFRRNLRCLMVWCIKDYWTVAFRSSPPRIDAIPRHAALMMKFALLLLKPPP